jgi:uncharacterized protein YutE (UPF0331/DUF86 family)
MVRPDVARQKIAAATARLEHFLADSQSRDLASFYLLLAIQDVIDLAAHWVADAGWPPPPDASSTFDLLARQGAIEPGLADGLRAAAGLRNRIAHGYSGIDHARLHDEFTQGVAILRRFLAAAADAAHL